MPAPTFTRPVQGVAPNQFVQNTRDEAAINEALRQLWLAIAAGEGEEQVTLVLNAALSALSDADRAEVARDDAQGVLPDRLRRDVATLIADNDLTYTAAQPGTVTENDIIRTRAEGFAYSVLASGATDQDLTTAGGVKLRVLPGTSGRLPDAAFGAGGAGDSLAAIQLCLDVAAARGLAAEITGPRRTSQAIVIEPKHSGLTVFFNGEGSEIKLLDGADFAAVSPETASMVVFDVPDGETLRDFTMIDPVLDGNKTGIAQNDDTNFSSGIWTHPRGNYVNVTIVRPCTRNTKNIGILEQVGGIKFINPVSYGNRWHGIATADNTASPYSDDRAAVFVSPITEDNGTYGIDFSRGRGIVEGVWQSRRNGLGGGKASIGCRYVQIDTAILEDNAEFGFRTTGAMPDWVFIAKRMEIRGTTQNGVATGIGLNLSSGRRVEIGQIVSEDNAANAKTQYDVSLVVPDVKVGIIIVKNAACGGFVCQASTFDIGLIDVRECDRVGYFINGGKGTVESFYLENNNQDGITENDGAAARHGGSVGNATHQVLSGRFSDTQAVATQTIAFFATQAVRLHLAGVDFGSDIASGEHVRSAGSGTRVTFGSGIVGFKHDAKGTHIQNGATTTANIPIALGAASNQVVRGVYSPASADAAAVASYRDSINGTTLQIRWASTLPAGTNNIAVDYAVASEVLVP